MVSTDGNKVFDELDGAATVTTVVINGDTYALVTARDDDGLQIVDISTPASPKAVASITDGVMVIRSLMNLMVPMASPLRY